MTMCIIATLYECVCIIGTLYDSMCIIATLYDCVCIIATLCVMINATLYNSLSISGDYEPQRKQSL